MANILNISNTTLRNIINKKLRINIQDKRRDREISEGRFIYSYICMNYLGMRQIEVAKSMRRDHATVIHGVKRTQELYDVDKEFKKKYDDVMFIAKKMNTMFTKETRRESERRQSLEINHVELHDLKKEIAQLKRANTSLQNRLYEVSEIASILSDFNITEEHVEPVKERIELYFKALEWKGSGYDGTIYNSHEGLANIH